MKENTTKQDSSINDFGFTPFLIEIERIFPKFPTIAKVVTLTVGLPLLILGTEIAISCSFSQEFEHYPTLPFAALTSPIFVILSLFFLWRERYAARFITSVFLFFGSIIFIQVNSELAANPTELFEVRMYYRIFIYSIILLALTCISCNAFPKMPERSAPYVNNNTSSLPTNNQSLNER